MALTSYSRRETPRQGQLSLDLTDLIWISLVSRRYRSPARGVFSSEKFSSMARSLKFVYIGWSSRQCSCDKTKTKISNTEASLSAPVIIGFSMGNCFTTLGKNDKASLAKMTLEYRPTVVIAPCDNVPVSKGSPGKTEAITWGNLLSLFLQHL